MTKISAELTQFIEDVKVNQCLWGLQDETEEGWVVCDSVDFENTDVMPLWSNEALAAVHCSDEWKNYNAVAIPLNEFLEYWVADFNEDGVLIGTNWDDKSQCDELDPIVLAKLLVEVEAE